MITADMKRRWHQDPLLGDFSSGQPFVVGDTADEEGGWATSTSSAIRASADDINLENDRHLMKVVDQALAERRLGLGFTKALEQEYEAQMGRRRDWEIMVGLWWFAFMLVGCLVVDLVVEPSLIPTSAPLRLAGGLLCLLGTCGMRLTKFKRTWGRWFTIVPLLFGVGVVAYIGKISAEPYADRYIIGAGVVILLIVTLIQLRGRDTVLFCLSALGIFEWLLFADIGPARSYSMADVAIFAPMVILSAMFFALRHERISRRVFLLRIKDELQARELVATNARLTVMSLTDPLTGVDNRRAFEASLTRAWKQAATRRTPLALLMIDIDHFKAYNDELGHAQGDKCLCDIAQALQSHLRANLDSLARYGGEEFAALCPDADEREALLIAERMRLSVEALGIEHRSRPDRNCVTVSIGVVSLRPSNVGIDLPDFIRTADQALYSARMAGRNCVMGADRQDVEHEAYAQIRSAVLLQ